MINKGLSRLGIFFLYLISLLPFWLLYIISDILFVLLYYVIHYRRKVVKDNLRNSFPEKTAQERSDIEKKYFKYLADLIVETIKTITLSKEEIKQRVTCTNPELLEQYLGQNKSIITVSGHYCNWEYAALNFSAEHDETFMIIYKPLTNPLFDKFFINIRARFGGLLVSMSQTMRKMTELRKVQTVSVLLGDQTPVRSEVNYFTEFLNQPTPVFLGIEKLAKLFDDVVVFYHMQRVKRGYYTYTLIPITENAKQTEPYEITNTHVKCLEDIIRKEPQYWLWSHRRWKFKPEDLGK